MVLWIFFLIDFPGEIEIIPADDGILDKPFAPFGDPLFVFFRLGKFSGAASRISPGKPMNSLNFAELLFNSLPDFDVIDVS